MIVYYKERENLDWYGNGGWGCMLRFFMID